MKISSSSSFHHHREDHDGPDDPMTHRPRLVSSQDGTTHAGRFCWNLSIRRSGPGDLVIKDFGDFVEKNRWIG